MAEVSKNTKYVKLDDGVSFALVRTNPKLTTNMKLMYNGKKMYMESYASSELMNRTTYKNVSVKPNSTYNKDISKFLVGSGSQAYNVYQNFSDVAISDSYDNQYETLYWCGAEYIYSSFYDEEIGFVAPLYLREKMPNYFLIFRLDTPSNYNLNKDRDGNILDSNFDFKKDILDKAVLIKTFDLREGSVLGDYIRNYVEQDTFEFDKSMYVNFTNHEVTYYGINRVNGILEKKVENFKNELLKSDDPILKTDKWFTEGFERNGLIFPYIMNIEYLFDDDTFKREEGESYDFARYIGLYCNNIEFGEFSSLDELIEFECTQDNAIYYFEDNKNVLHRYTKTKETNDYDKLVDVFRIDGKVVDEKRPFDKRLISGFENERITAYAEQLDINEGYINRAQYGFEILKPFEPGDWVAIEYDGNIEYYFADNINFNNGVGATKFRFNVNENSSVNDIAENLAKSVNLNKKSKFEAKSFDNTVVFYSKREGEQYNGSEFGGAKMLMEASLIYNRKISSHTSDNIKFVSISDLKSELKIDQNDKRLLYGDYYIGYFKGSCEAIVDLNTDTYKNIFKIYADDSEFFNIDRYLKTINGNGRKISSNIIYVNGEGDIDPEYRIIIVELLPEDLYDELSESELPENLYNRGYDISISSSYQVEILDKFKPKHGVLSWFPVKDFDFDINTTTYGLYSAFVDECNTLSKKIVYSDEYNTEDTADSDTTTTQEDTIIGIKELAKSPFIDSYGDSLDTEYEYYLEKFHPELCLMSKSVPYISKWGYYDEQKDSCENPYRLNISKIFGVNNLSSNIYFRGCDEKEYTHNLPYYMTFNTPDYHKDYQYILSDETYIKYNTDAIVDEQYLTYIDDSSDSDEYENIGFYDCVDYWINVFKNTDKNMFSYFFSGKKYGKRFDRKYSRLLGGDKLHNTSTLFRGVKFEVIRQFNGVDKKTNEYNNYKFSIIYIPVMIKDVIFDNTIHFVKNDTFKFIVGIVFVNTLLGFDNHNIFNKNIDYFNKCFLYSGYKNIIRAENTNKIYTINLNLNFEQNFLEKESYYKINNLFDDTVVIEKVNSILESYYRLVEKVDSFIFYMWGKVGDNGLKVFITKTLEPISLSDIICELDLDSFKDFKDGGDYKDFIKPFNKNDEYYKYYTKLIKLNASDLDELGFNLNWKRYYEDYDITIYRNETFKYFGDINCDLNAPDIIYENMSLNNICNLNIESAGELGYEVYLNSLPFKEGSLRNILLKDTTGNITELRIYGVDGIDLHYNSIENKDVITDIKIDDMGNLNITFKDGLPYVYLMNNDNIDKLKLDISIEDKIDIVYGSLSLRDYFSVFEQVSMSHITDSINNNTNVKYYSTVDDNKYKIKVIEPDNIEVEDKYEAFPITISQNNANVVGSIEIKEKQNKDKIGKIVINRYSGYYNPIFTDILYYDDYICDKVEFPYSNTNIDYNYNDGYGKFGIIRNIYYHKTNVLHSDDILSFENPIYPAINEYALDYKDYNVFSSSWDEGYFVSQDNLEKSSNCEGIGSMKDGLCMFGSKYLNLPDNIFIDTFENGEMWDGKMVIDDRDNSDTEIMYKEINNRAVRYYLFIEKRLKRYLKENLMNVFSKYINKEYSFGNKGTIEDDVDEYVEKNLLKLYKVDNVYMYVRGDKIGINNKNIENEYLRYVNKDNIYKIAVGFPVERIDDEEVLKDSKFIMSKINDFDRHIIYNLKSGFKESFGFGVSIKRK